MPALFETCPSFKTAGKKVFRYVKQLYFKFFRKEHREMKTVSKISAVYVFLTVLCVVACASDKVKVTIDYGGAHETREYESLWKEGITALEALKLVAQVETHKVNDYVFVTSIDGVKGKSGDMAWYYEINGKRVDKLAYERVLNKDENTRWIYTRDTCSSKSR